ncbi:MAG: sugar ABC transporter permease [Gemmatimonadetes bacterium]|jgi:putative chitobiose transport system permease protein|nr:sugar ABC transporter permease [Gemmatimonadota bacterium]MBT5142422.1 sugar ABC transporter permease [Gemmatimonadota bacterium]MBT5588200.1 sugar ABC transporter permease [Gemmatimonadota bacterium]MBT5961051.1 sugar ABC transporter permease [Gemmatimonadota bacterium]MBT6626051.1 sugar ABC transporter permease [Gemmatimonadota bacterium]
MSKRLPLRQRAIPYVFIAPGLLMLATFFAYPLLDTFWLSLHRYNIFNPPVWAGLDNFERAFGDELFWRVTANTLLYAAMVVPALVVVSFFLALLMNSTIRGIQIFRTVYYIPVVTSIVVAGIAWKWLYNSDGLINAVLKGFGIAGPSWLADTRGVPEALLSFFGLEVTSGWFSEPCVALASVAMVTIWKASPYYMIIYLAGLQGIPPQLEEAARVDGAGRWRIVRHITIPSIQPYTLVVSIIATIGALRTFGEVYVMTSGGPFHRTNLLAYYIYTLGFKYLEVGYAAAVSLLLLGLILVFAVINFRVAGGDADR